MYFKRFARSLFYIYSKYLLKDKYGLTFVICKYKEDISWVKNLPYKYIINDVNYVKDKNYDDGKIDYSKVIKLKDIGKDAYSILTFIIDNYNSLPNYTGFLQGEPFDHSPFLAVLISKFKGQEFYGLSPNTLYKRGDNDDLGILKTIEATTKKHLGIEKDIFKFPTGTQFIVSRDKILKHSIEEYKFLREKISEVEKVDPNCLNPLHFKKPCSCLYDIPLWMFEVWSEIYFDDGVGLIDVY